MGENSKIQWTDHTFNPWEGCTKVSSGCAHCFAETLVVGRFKHDVWGPGKARKRTSEAYWRKPILWDAQAKKEGLRIRVFCGSLCDVFDAEVPTAWLADLMESIRQTENLNWQLLTKRPGRIVWALTMVLDHINSELSGSGENYPDGLTYWLQNWLGGDPPRNVWLGTSCENQKTADIRIPRLLSVPAMVRFLSCEPLLGPIDLDRYFQPDEIFENADCLCKDGEYADYPCVVCQYRERRKEGIGIHWIIAGGESGPGARPMHPDWALSLSRQCKSAGVPFFFKQWGSNEVVYDRDIDDPDCRRCSDMSGGQWLNIDGGSGFHGERVIYVKPVDKHVAGDLLDGVQYHEFPEVATK